MERFLGKYSPHLYAVLRIVVGLMFAMHGSQKLFGWPGTKHPGLPPLLIAGGVIELVCGIMIALGLLTGCAAFVASGEMAVAFFKQHLPGGWLPIMNGGEAAVVYCFLFLYMAAQGSGVWSIDALMRRGPKARAR